MVNNYFIVNSENIHQIPNNVNYLQFDDDFNEIIEVGVIPNHITFIHFGDDFNQPLKPGIIPNSVTHIIFDYGFNQPLKIGDIPNSVTNLSFGQTFNQLLASNVIPNSVICLEFGLDFNQPFYEKVLPESVKYLFLSRKYNQDLSNILSRIYTNLTLIISNDKLYKKYISEVSYPFNKFISNVFSSENEYILLRNKLKKVYHEELIEKVLHPERLHQIAKLYHIDFIDLIDNY